MKNFEVTKVVVIKTFITAESADDAMEIAETMSEETGLTHWHQVDQVGATEVLVYPYRAIRNAEGAVQLVKDEE